MIFGRSKEKIAEIQNPEAPKSNHLFLGQHFLKMSFKSVHNVSSYFSTELNRPWAKQQNSGSTKESMKAKWTATKITRTNKPDVTRWTRINLSRTQEKAWKGIKQKMLEGLGNFIKRTWKKPTEHLKKKKKNTEKKQLQNARTKHSRCIQSLAFYIHTEDIGYSSSTTSEGIEKQRRYQNRKQNS